MTGTVDLNADLGEECGDDAAMLAVVTSANISCGVHAGGPAVMARTVERARALGVGIGAHFSYPDRAGFGRRVVDLPSEVLSAEVAAQVGALAGFAGRDLRHVKAHGALYNTMADDDTVARAVMAGVQRVVAELCLDDVAVLMLPACLGAEVARECGFRVIAEGFADRAYTPDGRLVPRAEPGAVLNDVAAIAAQAVALVHTGGVESVCVHGDTPAAVVAARAVRAALRDAGIEMASFASVA